MRKKESMSSLPVGPITKVKVKTIMVNSVKQNEQRAIDETFSCSFSGLCSDITFSLLACF